MDKAAGESSGITAPDGGRQSEPKPKSDQEPNHKKKKRKKNPWYKKVIDNPYVQEATNFVLDSVPIVSNIKSGLRSNLRKRHLRK